MEDLAGGAAASNDAVAIVNEGQGATPPNPISTEGNTGEIQQQPDKVEAGKDAKEGKEGKEGDKKPISTREALLKAAEKLDKQQAEDKAKTPPLKTEDQKKDETGTEDQGKKPVEPVKTEQQKKDDGKPFTETGKDSDRSPPSRFSSDAKAAWDAAPEPVKAEVRRMEREMTAGLERYKADAEAFAPVREYDSLAKQHGTSIKDALDRYTNLERTLTSNPLQGLQQVCEYAGISLREVAAAVMGQSPDQVSSQQDAVIRSLNSQLAELKQQIGGVTDFVQQQQNSSQTAAVIEFAKDHPRVEELADDIAFLLESKRAKDLPEAYELADRLNPVPAKPHTAASSAAAPAFDAQTIKGTKSVSGAPSAGSDPTPKKQPSKSIRESLKEAAGRV